ncbi:MAG: CcmD family protein [Saprospiraceae bacterium]|jgi:CcmD family protein
MKNRIKIKKFVSLFIIQMMWTTFVSAQSNSLDFLRSTGKIYSVVAVIAVIFVGIVFYLFRLDNKLTKLENHIKNEQ